MGILWMVDGVFCRDPILYQKLLQEHDEAESRQQARQGDGGLTEELPPPGESSDSRWETASSDSLLLTDPQADQIIATPYLPPPPPNSEVVARHQANLEHRIEGRSGKEVEAVSEVGPAPEVDSDSRAMLAQVMSRSVVTVGAQTSVESALEKLRAHRCHHLPVVDQESRLLGLVSDRDLLGNEGILEPFMVAQVLTATPDTELAEAAAALVACRFHSLVVIDQERRPVGMLTSSDLMTYLVEHPALKLWLDQPSERDTL